MDNLHIIDIVSKPPLCGERGQTTYAVNEATCEKCLSSFKTSYPESYREWMKSSKPTVDKLLEKFVLNAELPMEGQTDFHNCLKEYERLKSRFRQQLKSLILSWLPESYKEPVIAPDGRVIDEYKLAYNIALKTVREAIEKELK